MSACSAAEPYPDRVSIGVVQGRVTDAVDGERFRSPLHGETVTVRGVVHQLMRWKTSEGEDVYGFFVQSAAADADGDPQTSDGLFVYMGRTPALVDGDQKPVNVRVGDALVLKGEVEERYGQTELQNARVLDRVKRNAALPEPVELDLPARWSARQRYLERLEGMRVVLPAGAVTVVGTQPHSRMGDMTVWVVGPEHPLLEREDPSARRLFRPAHPLSVAEEVPLEELHGDRLLLGSLGLASRLDGEEDFLPPLHAGSRFEGAITGAVQYAYREYRLQAAAFPEVVPAEPPEVDVPSPESGLRIASYNVENLYDWVDDPFDGCDFSGNEGCSGVRAPFNYVPASEGEYRARLRRMADQIVREMNAPDVLMIQEAEDQDIARVEEGRLVYGETDDADGATDALQDLALEIVKAGGPRYRVAVDRDGTDRRGIICAWLYLPSRLEVVPPGEAGELLGPEPTLSEQWTWMPMVKDVSNPKAFNAVYNGNPDADAEQMGVFSRSVQVLCLRDKQTGERVWTLNNHFSAGPGRRVERRRQQAGVNAALVRAILRQDPGALIVAGGDLNVFPRPDDPLDPPSDQLGPLYEAGLFNVYDRIVEEAPANAYSYIYRGVPNTLDHYFLSPAAVDRLGYARYMKLNASAPEAFAHEVPLRGSDHDPLLIVLSPPEASDDEED